MTNRVYIDGNEAAARIAYALSEVIAIYPITPASAMGELADAWAAVGRRNLWGVVPEVVEMQSEGGAAGALHGAVQQGALGTTFTASQGLLLMLPNMFKIAGELTPTVIHVAARSLATHALSIFGDHSDVMAARSTGFAVLAAGSVQEAHDLALVAHAATLRTRVPFLHFFDGFRTSHEVNRVDLLDDDDIAALIDETGLLEHRLRGLSPDRPVLRGSAQNPDVFFQAREAASPFHRAVPDVVSDVMAELFERTGRRYGVVDYQGAADADRVVVLMGSAAGAATEAVGALCASGQRVGLLQVRLFRPFPSEAVLAALPRTVRSIAVLDRTKEPGSPGEPLWQDVVAAFADFGGERRPRIIGGRYGLASKELTPAMVKAVLDELDRREPIRHFTVGIVDDVSGTSLQWDPDFRTETTGTAALLYGLGSDGTVGASKSAVKIVGGHTGLHAQGYFVYDSKKSGSMTVSHLRFSPDPIVSTYLVDRADVVACTQFSFVERIDLLERAAPGARLLLNSPYGPDEVWDHLPAEMQQDILDNGIELWVVDATRLAHEAGLGGHINAIMQPCFLNLGGMLPQDAMVAAVKEAVERDYGKQGSDVVERNHAAVDRALAELHVARLGDAATSTSGRRSPMASGASDFVTRVTMQMLAGRGDLLPVSALPVDGTFPVGTAKWEKRSLAAELPVWDPELCIDCGKCTIVCPHAAIRMKAYEPSARRGAPDGFLAKAFRSRDLPGLDLTIQVAPDDCTGCGVCVDVCPAKSKETVAHKALDMRPVDPTRRQAERAAWDFFLGIAELDRAAVDPTSVKTSQLLQPLFEFSGACAGCGETPYLKLLTQLFGDRMVVANATGCSSIFGGNLPTTPWSCAESGRGPAWANSLFEDNAEFGLGMRLGADGRAASARLLLEQLAARVDPELVDALLGAEQAGEEAVAAQRSRVGDLRARLTSLVGGPDDVAVRRLLAVADDLVDRSVWIVGGDGWAYDIGSSGLDHVLASGRNVNVLVLDTEVYSNTGGQASKATPRAAVAKFAASGKSTPKKDLGMIAASYGNVYVAQVALGANDIQTLKALREADAWPGPALVIAYSSCIAHGIDGWPATSMSHQKDAVRSGYWPLYRYHPGRGEHEHPFSLDCKAPTISIREFAAREARFAMLERTDPDHAAALMTAAQADVDERWRLYQQLAGVERTATAAGGDEDATL